MLFDCAKKLEGKNGVAFRLLKHSGHSVGSTISKSWKCWKLFLNLINQGLEEEDRGGFLASIQYKLESLRPLLQRLLTGRMINDVPRAGFMQTLGTILPQEGSREFMLKNLQNNFFNEICAGDSSKIFISHVFELLLQSYRDQEDCTGNTILTVNKAIDFVYATLRVKQFYAQSEQNTY